MTEGAILAANNQDEFAGVLAHEMGHQLAGHFCLQSEVGYRPGPAPAQLGSLRQGMDPGKEREADRYSVGILVDAGYDPAARSRVINRSRISPNGTNQARASDGTRQGTALQKNQSALARAQAALLGDY